MQPACVMHNYKIVPFLALFPRLWRFVARKGKKNRPFYWKISIFDIKNHLLFWTSPNYMILLWLKNSTCQNKSLEFLKDKVKSVITILTIFKVLFIFWSADVGLSRLPSLRGWKLSEKNTTALMCTPSEINLPQQTKRVAFRVARL